MGSMLRSDPMTLCDVFIQPEAAFEILSELGEMGCVQFLDLNEELQLFQRSYVTEVCRYAEMERKLRYFKSEMEKENIKIPIEKKGPKAINPIELFPYENLFDKWENDISEMSANQANLMKNYIELVEMSYVLNSIGPLLGDPENRRESKLGIGNLHAIRNTEILSGGQLTIITGVVRRTRCFPFEMMLWRISRGNIYYRQASYDKIVKDPKTGQDIRKVAFLAVCQGEVLSDLTEKVCSGFRVNIYPCPKSYNERLDLTNKIDARIIDLAQVLKKTKYHRCKALRVIAKQWWSWAIQVKKSKAIYHNLNRFNFDITKKCLIGQCWVPDSDLHRVQNCLDQTSKLIGTNVPSFLSRTESTGPPPTYHRTNKFTNGFQTLINVYGVSTYGELNPGLYTIITFPFLFSLMFGDIGHGTIVLLFGGWMIKNEKKFSSERSNSEIWKIFFGGRYIIFLLGAFSIYAGFVYNDVFCKAMNLGSSAWLNLLPTLHYTPEELQRNHYVDLDPGDSSPYLFGIDPIWTITTNNIMVLNSIKMKLSLIFGIVHMIFGLSLSLVNDVYFQRRYSIFLQFIPEMLFMVCLFLWLVFLMYFKWFVYRTGVEGPKGGGCAPQILILFIDMVLMAKTKPPHAGCDAYMFEGQRFLQTFLVVVGLLCIPIMLLGTPLYLHYHHKKKRIAALKLVSHFRRYQRHSSDKSNEKIMAEVKKNTISFGELMIHQSIHTIEYVLSTISHTASYLRLWALSLAHSSLSDMLYNMILSQLALRDHSIAGAFKIFVMFPVWAVFTVCILVVMEGLSAFLHTLRLHWVEFMSKFYSGGGWPFTPFSFSNILEETDSKIESACKPQTLQDN